MELITNKVRANIAKVKGSEIQALADSAGLREMWKKRQHILTEMNQAKRAAADKAAEPFLKQLIEVDQEYAMLLQMIGENGDKT